MQFRDYLRTRTVFLDGGMGTMLQAAGLAPGQAPAKWSLTHPDEVKAVHRAYYEAGSNLVCTNTFGVDRLHFRGDALAEHIRASIASGVEDDRQKEAAAYYAELKASGNAPVPEKKPARLSPSSMRFLSSREGASSSRILQTGLFR